MFSLGTGNAMATEYTSLSYPPLDYLSVDFVRRIIDNVHCVTSPMAPSSVGIIVCLKALKAPPPLPTK